MRRSRPRRWLFMKTLLRQFDVRLKLASTLLWENSMPKWEINNTAKQGLIPTAWGAEITGDNASQFSGIGGALLDRHI